MESLQRIKSRIGAVKNIGQITKAMEAVSAAKMRKSQEMALKTRPYAFKALELLEKMTRLSPAETPLTQLRPVNNILNVIIASDRGLAGSFNTQVFRVAEKIVSKDSLCLAVGKKAERFLLKRNLKVVKSFHGFGDFVAQEEVEPFADFIIKGFQEKKWDKVMTVSMHFRTALKQEPLSRQILPLDLERIRETVKQIVPEFGKYANLIQNSKFKSRSLAKPNKARDEGEALSDLQNSNVDYLFEPSAKEVLEALLPHLVRMQIYHLVLEANASEHSSRRVAMKQASDNAQELSEKFTLDYNKARQAGITKEIIEIVSTQSALT